MSSARCLFKKFSDKGKQMADFWKDTADGRTTLFWFDPARIRVKDGLNGRDLQTADNIAHVEGLAALIAENGFMPSHPLEVFREGDDVYLSDGHCRLAAVMLLRGRGVVVEKVPCIPEARGTNEVDRILGQISHNSAKPLNPLEEARNLKRALGMGLSVAEVAKRIGKSPSYVTHALDFLAAPVEVHAAVSAGEISTTLATEIVRKEGATRGAETVRKAVERAKASGKAKATRKTVNAVSATPPAPEPTALIARELSSADEAKLRATFNKTGYGELRIVHDDDVREVLDVKRAALVLAREFLMENIGSHGACFDLDAERIVAEISHALGEASVTREIENV